MRDTRSALRVSLVATCSRALTGILDRDKSCGPLLRSQNKLVDESYSIRRIGMGFPKDLLADDEIAVPMSKLLGSNIVIEVMPQMNGPDLARRLKPLHPAMKALFMSGYLDETVSLQEGDSLLLKPFSEKILLEKLRTELDNEPAP